jgi:Plasmid replication region DNA-binding N-term
MPSLTLSPPTRGISQSDVSHAADSLLRSGERPTIDKVRAKIGRGSPNTINPMLDAWWKTLAARLDSGPAAFHRLPEVVAHLAESLWMHAQEEARRRAKAEHKTTERQNADKEQTLKVRSHVLTLREGELDSRLRDRDRTIEELNLRLRKLTGMLGKEQATRESQALRLTTLEAKILARRNLSPRRAKASTPRTPKRKHAAGRAGPGRGQPSG